jgi:hypothetical protein
MKQVSAEIFVSLIGSIIALIFLGYVLGLKDTPSHATENVSHPRIEITSTPTAYKNALEAKQYLNELTDEVDGLHNYETQLRITLSALEKENADSDNN